jgi:hypothetical protein
VTAAESVTEGLVADHRASDLVDLVDRDDDGGVVGESVLVDWLARSTERETSGSRGAQPSPIQDHEQVATVNTSVRSKITHLPLIIQYTATRPPRVIKIVPRGAACWPGRHALS